MEKDKCETVNIKSTQCPLCEFQASESVKNQHWQDRREFFHCQNCDLIFVPSQYFSTEDQDRARYSTHENNPDDPGYVQFLSQIFHPMDQSIPNWNSASRALDYGSGPNPVLVRLLLERGIPTDHYDLFFQPDRSLLQKNYPLVISTEVVEHFKNPRVDWADLLSFVSSKGHLVVMTQLHQGLEHFEKWWYPKDFTHVTFYSEKTVRWIAARFGLEMLYIEKSVIVFAKSFS